MIVESGPNTVPLKIIMIAEELGAVGKDKRATVKMKAGGEYSYAFRGVDAVMAALRPLFIRHHLVVLPVLDKDRMRQEETTTIGVYDIVFIDADNPSSSLVVPALGYGADYSDKGPGKALSYAWRTTMEKVFFLAAADGDNEDQDITIHGVTASPTSSDGPLYSHTSTSDALTKPIWFGKYSGTMWHEIDRGYLNYLAKSTGGQPAGRVTAQAELDRRAGVVEGSIGEIAARLDVNEPPPIDDDDLPF